MKIGKSELSFTDLYLVSDPNELNIEELASRLVFEKATIMSFVLFIFFVGFGFADMIFGFLVARWLGALLIAFTVIMALLVRWVLYREVDEMNRAQMLMEFGRLSVPQ